MKLLSLRRIMMDKKIIERATEILSAKRLDCVLALIDLDGHPTASTITVSKVDGIKWITFVTGMGSNKVKRINQCKWASVCFSSSDPSPSPLYNITLVGDIEVITDLKVKKEMWYDGCENHFSGPEDPNYCVLKFTTKRYDLFIEWEEEIGVL
jgi:general stress protein 26